MLSKRKATPGILLLSALLCLAFLSHAHAAPRLVVPDARFDAHRVQEGEVIAHSFTLRNPGDRPLVIQQVKPDCGCTTAEFDPRIEPGGEGHVTLRLDTRGYEGRIAKFTRVLSNDPEHKIVLLTMEAEVWTPIKLSKGYVVFKGKAGETLSEGIDIRAGMEKPLSLEPEAFDLEEQVAYRIEEVEAGRHFRIHFSSLPGPVCRYHGTLRLVTNYPEKPEIEIRIRARFKDEG